MILWDLGPGQASARDISTVFCLLCTVLRDTNLPYLRRNHTGSSFGGKSYPQTGVLFAVPC
jgi:hypothetical protein